MTRKRKATSQDTPNGSGGETEEEPGSSDTSEMEAKKTEDGSDDSKSLEGGDGDEHDSKALYRDYSKDRSMQISAEDMRESVQTFPMKLHSILSNPEFSSIISWLPHGRAWRILQHKAFEERVIPLYFRHGRYSSFARQVNGWGFKRIAHGPDYNSYYHEMFLRGLPRLCEKMKRLSGKDEKNEENPDAPVPDFYALSRQNPLPEMGEGMQHNSPGMESSGVDGGNPSNSSGLGALDRSSNAGGLAGLTSLLGSLQRSQQQPQHEGVNLSSNGSDMLSGLVLQALEMRRNEIMQRLAALVAEGTSAQNAAPASAPAPRTANPLASIVSLLKAQQEGNSNSAPAPSNTSTARSNNNSGGSGNTNSSMSQLMGMLMQNGNQGRMTNPAPTPAPAAPSPMPTTTNSHGLAQGLASLVGNNSNNNSNAGGLDLLALIRKQQEQQHSPQPQQHQSPQQQTKPPRAAPASRTPAPSVSDLQQQLMNNPNAAALLQQLQGSLIGNKQSSSGQAQQHRDNNSIFGSNTRAPAPPPAPRQPSLNSQPSAPQRQNNPNAAPVPSTNSGRQNSGPAPSPGNIDLSTILSGGGGPNALANLAALLQGQRSQGQRQQGNSEVGASPANPPAQARPSPQPKQPSQQPPPSPHMVPNPVPAPSTVGTSGGGQQRQSQQQTMSQAPGSLPAALTALLGQMQQNGGQLPPNAAAVLGQLSQQQQQQQNKQQNPQTREQSSSMTHRPTPQEQPQPQPPRASAPQPSPAPPPLQSSPPSQQTNQAAQLQAFLNGSSGMPNLQAFLNQQAQSSGANVRQRPSVAQTSQVANSMQRQLIGGGGNTGGGSGSGHSGASDAHRQLAALLGLNLGGQGGQSK